MATIAVKREDLEGYEKVLSNVDFAIAFREQAKEQRKLVDAIKGLLNSYIKIKKYPQKVIDAQNRSFSKKQAEDIVSIVKESFSSTYDNLEAYIDKALKEIESSVKPSQDSLSNNDIRSLKTSIKPIFDSIALEIKNIKQAKRDYEKPNQASKTAESSELENARVTLRNTVTGKAIKAFVKKNIFVPKLDLNLISKFLSKNVFTNIEKALTSRNFAFRPYGVREKRIKNLYGVRIWNPAISDIAAPFKWFERKLTDGIISGVKHGIRFLGKKIVETANNFFPIIAVASILKFGFKAAIAIFNIATHALRGAIKVISGAISMGFSIVSFAASTIKKTSIATAKLLTASIDKITGSKFLKITAKGILAFFKTYAGAYVLGFILGRIAARAGSIIKLALSAKDFVLEKFNEAKNWWNDNVKVPYIDPILTWVSKHFSETSKSIADDAQLIVEILTDGEHSLLENINTIVGLMFSNTFDGKNLPTILKDVSQKFLYVTEWIKNNLNGENIKNFLLKSGLNIGFGLLGSTLGAAAGTLLTPFLGPFGPVLGAVAGSFIAGLTSKGIMSLIERIKIEGVKPEETKLEKYIRENWNSGEESFSEAIYGKPSSSRNIKLLKQLGTAASDLNPAQSISNLKESLNFKLMFGRNLSGTAEEYAYLKNIDKLSPDKIVKEISDTLEEMGIILQTGYGSKGKNTPRGMMSFADIKKLGKEQTWGKSNITLLDSSVQNLFNGNIESSKINPYWAKVARDFSILNALRMLIANQISPKELISIANSDISNIDFFSNRFIDGAKLNLGQDYEISLHDLVTGAYFRDSSKSQDAINVLREFYHDHPVLSNRNVDLDTIASYFPTKFDLAKFRRSTKISWENVLQGTRIIPNAARFPDLSDIYEEIIRFSPDLMNQADVDTLALRIQQTLGSGAPDKFQAMAAEDKKTFVRKMLEDLKNGKEVQYLGFDLDAATSRMSAAVDSLNGGGISSDDLRNALETALQASGTEEVGPTLEQYSQLVVFANENIKKAIPEIIKKLRERGVDKRAIVAVFGKHANATDVQDDVVSPKPVD